MKIDVFSLNEGEWQARIGDKVIAASWNSRGAALAGVATELRRFIRRQGKTLKANELATIKAAQDALMRASKSLT